MKKHNKVMKKAKLDKASILKSLAYLLMGFGLGLASYQYLTDWMPLAAGVTVIIGILLLVAFKK
jgi:hypothetical protein